MNVNKQNDAFNLIYSLIKCLIISKKNHWLHWSITNNTFTAVINTIACTL